jgi:hypothetical protein
MTRSSS